MWLLLVAFIVLVVVMILIWYAKDMANGKCAPMPSRDCNRCGMPKPRCHCRPKKCEFC